MVGWAIVVGVPAARCALNNSVHGQCSQPDRLSRLCSVMETYRQTNLKKVSNNGNTG